MEKGKAINPALVKQWLQDGDAVLIDVREPGEHASHHIPEAILHPLSRLNSEKLALFEGKKIILHCVSGKRSNVACNRLLSENPNLEIYQLEGGILKYFELCGGAHYHGTCFVFDEREALDPELHALSEKIA